jgi:hypothetical protein
MELLATIRAISEIRGKMLHNAGFLASFVFYEVGKFHPAGKSE